mgnify:CR=1 FL=1
MEVVNKNVESKRDIINKLKEINVNSVSKHQEIEIDSYITSIVMVTTTSNISGIEKEEYNIYMLIYNKNTDELYGKFNSKICFNIDEATKYYDKLILKMESLSADKIANLVSNL